jgi:hypothetical protein
MMPENSYVGVVQRTLEVIIYGWFILRVGRIRQFAKGV